MPIVQVNGRSFPCRGILFDKDGTLLQFMALWGGWADYVLQFMEERLSFMGSAFTVPKSKVLGTVHNEGGKVSDYDAQGPLAMGTVEETKGILAWQLYAAGMPWNEAIIQVNQITNNAMYQLRQDKPAFPMPGLRDFLLDCRKASIDMAVVTSDITEAALEQIEWLGIKDFFSVIIGRDQAVNGKPHPEMVELACKRLGLTPEEVVVIGDSNSDMQMAKQAGAVLAVGIIKEDGGSEHLIDADIVIKDYNDIKVK
ncbi:HAD family hydrolase [Paenibacillus dakarensis]|uniref:HAD family hydrolase n=1 Tax=Paenibacillus dakarensis TaxID=1527293 RepID=UPI0006D5A7B4|nr:HAD family hydrolase [Paenibacillus dakarensis]